MVSVKFLATFVAIVPLVSCFSLDGLNKTSELEHLSVIPKKYPELTNFVSNAINRFQQQNSASVVDRFTLHLLLEVLQNELVELVKSKHFPFFSYMIKDMIKELAIPVLGVVPISDIAELYETLDRNPELRESLAEDAKDILGLLITCLQERIALFQLEKLK